MLDSRPMWSSPERRPCPPVRGVRLAALLLALSAPLFAQTGGYDPLRVDVPSLLLAAERGDTRAALALGTLYATGAGRTQDDSEARRWFRVAAEGGLAEAQYNLALMLARGRGGTRDAAEALRWYEAAGEQGVARAQFNAGMLLVGGAPGVPRDEARGAGWLRRAAERGLAAAEYNLGVLREFGRGMPRDAPQSPPPSPAGAGVVNRWVLGRDPSRYTLQLFSRRDEASVREYLQSHGIDDEGGYFRSRSDGSEWFSVVWGDFASHAEACAAAGRLPAALGIKEPWVRNFGAIHKVLVR